MPTISLGDLELQYRVEIRPRRRLPALRYDGGNEITLLLPRNFSQRREAEFIRSCERWIRRQVARGVPPRTPRQFVSGEQFAILGRPHTLEVVQVRRAGLPKVRPGERIVVEVRDVETGARATEVRRRLAQFYANLSSGIFDDRVDHWADRMGLRPSAVSVRAYRSSWGYCRRDRSISFNWRLIQAPSDVVEYVVVHELAHLRHMNHGREFWHLVGVQLPDWPQRRRWLRSHGQELIW